MVMDGTLRTTLFSQVYTAACENFFLQARGCSNMYSRDALKEAGPKPGGFRCALDEESADALFYGLTLDGKVVWASRDE